MGVAKPLLKSYVESREGIVFFYSLGLTETCVFFWKWKRVFPGNVLPGNTFPFPYSEQLKPFFLETETEPFPDSNCSGNGNALHFRFQNVIEFMARYHICVYLAPNRTINYSIGAPPPPLLQCTSFRQRC